MLLVLLLVFSLGDFNSIKVQLELSSSNIDMSQT